MTRIFVYGTLLQGMPNHRLLLNSALLGPAIIKADLHDLGCFPGVLLGQNLCVGEIYEVDASTLQALDSLEGFNPVKPEQSLFIRQVTQARTFSDGQVVSVMVYFYNVPWDCSAHTLIGHGDYRRRKFFDDQTYQWLGAYGSNLSLARIQNRIGNINNHVTGHLPGYGLVFNKSCRSGACANIQYTGDKADQCPVVAYQLSETQCLSLDDYEGAPTHYLRICVPMRVGNEIRLMQTYIAHPQMLIDQQYPDPAYLAFIEQGYREHSLGQLDVGHLPQPQG